MLPCVQAKVECEHPNASLYTFTGNLILGLPTSENEVVCPLSQASVLLRGCTLRNTTSVLAIAIFTGHESKVPSSPPHPSLLPPLQLLLSAQPLAMQLQYRTRDGCLGMQQLGCAACLGCQLLISGCMDSCAAAQTAMYCRAGQMRREDQ